MLWIRPLKFMDGEEAVLLREVVYRQEMISKGRQIGIALNIYGADNDDLFPTGDIVEALMPYIKRRDFFDGFIFTLPNVKSMIDVDLPNSTPIGHYNLPGGQVVVYVDSSTRWVPRK